MNILTKSQRRRGYTKVLEVIRPVIEPLKRFENVIDVVVQTNGAMGSPIWGPVKLAMMAANDHLETIEKLAQLLHRIVTSLERYRNYESLFHNHMHVQNAVGLLYSDLLDLCTRVVRFHSRRTIGKSAYQFMFWYSNIGSAIIFTSFEKEFKLVADNISHHSAQIDWAANAANIEEAKKARQDEENARTGIYHNTTSFQGPLLTKSQPRIGLLFNNGFRHPRFKTIYPGTKLTTCTAHANGL